MMNAIKSTARAIAVFILLAGLVTPCWSAVTLIADEGVNPESIRAIELVVDNYNAILKEKLGVELQQDLKLYICNSQDSYELRLIAMDLPAADAAKAAQRTDAMINPRTNKIALLVRSQEKIKFTQSSLANILANSLIDQLASYYVLNEIPRWIRSGVSGYISLVVMEKMGGDTLSRWKSDRVNTLRKNSGHIDVETLSALTDYYKWTDLASKNRLPYQMSELMVYYLQSRNGDNFNYNLVKYFSALKDGAGTKNSFKIGFGVDEHVFYKEVSSWIANEKMIKSTLKVEDYSDEKIGSRIETVLSIAQGVLHNHLGVYLAISQRFVIAKDRDDYVKRHKSEFGSSDEEVAKITPSPTWYFKGNTAIMNASNMQTPEKRATQAASIVMRRFLQLNTSNKQLEKLYWLRNGLDDWFKEQVSEQMGLVPAGQSALNRKKFLATVGVLPSLDKLSSEDGWNASRKVSSAVILNHLSVHATQMLIDKSGVEGFKVWFAAKQSKDDSDTIFKNAFGLSIEEFSQQVANGLKQ